MPKYSDQLEVLDELSGEVVVTVHAELESWQRRNLWDWRGNIASLDGQ